MQVLIRYAAEGLPMGQVQTLFARLLPEQVECIEHAKADPDRADELVKIESRMTPDGPASDRLLALGLISGIEVTA